MIQSLVPIPVDMPSAAIAFADMSPHALMNIDSLYRAPLALRVKVKEMKRLEVRFERTVNLVIISRYVSLEVSHSLALDLGLTDEQYDIWTEMEMLPFAVPLYCRKYVRGIRSPVPLLILG